MPQRGTSIEVLPSEKNFQYWLNRPYLGNSLRATLARANVLIVPYESFHGVDRPLFAHQTHELLAHLQAAADERFRPDICIEDSDYAEVALHNTDLSLPNIVAVSLVAPLVVNLVSEFIKRWVFQRRERADHTQIHFTLSMTGPGKTLDLHYDGPAHEFEEVVGHRVLDVLESQQKHGQQPQTYDGNDIPGHPAIPQ